jgi:hypothetical protein
VTLNFTATDLAGNTGWAKVDVLVLPDLAPVITIAANATTQITMGATLIAPQVGTTQAPASTSVRVS